MVEVAYRSAIEPAPGMFGSASAAPLVLTERRGLAQVQLAAIGRADAVDRSVMAVAAAFDGKLGGALPLAPGMVMAVGDAVVLWMAPDRWLVVGPDPESGMKMEEGLRKAMAGVAVAITDQSQARAVLRVRGAAWRSLLSKGCSLDLHPRSFMPGRCASTRLAHVPALLHALPSGDGVDLYVPRSYARSFWEWLVDAAAEYGYRVEP